MTKGCLPLARWSLLGVLATVAAACSTGTVVLLPEKDGRDAVVAVKQGDQEVLLTQPYAAARQTPLGPRAYTATAKEVDTLFGAALAAQPPRPAHFTLYFVEGKDEFTTESTQIVASVFAEIAKRPVPDVLVIGHADNVGTDQINDALSLQRAETVRAALIAHGIAPDAVSAIGRGKREPVVPTAEGVPEARNRRVEIVVR